MNRWTTIAVMSANRTATGSPGRPAKPRGQQLLDVLGRVLGAPGREFSRAAGAIRVHHLSVWATMVRWTMTPGESQHISAWINRPAAEVYRFASNPENLPRWARRSGRGEVTRVGENWVVRSPMGEVTVEFSPTNELGCSTTSSRCRQVSRCSTRCGWFPRGRTGVRWCSPCAAVPA